MAQFNNFNPHPPPETENKENMLNEACYYVIYKSFTLLLD